MPQLRVSGTGIRRGTRDYTNGRSNTWNRLKVRRRQATHQRANKAPAPLFTKRNFIKVAQLPDRVLLTKLVLPERVQNAIQEKTTEEQKVMTYAYLMKQAELEKQRRSIEASGISEFERVSKVSMLKWRGIEAIQNLAASPNAKVVVLGGTNSGIPVVLNPDK